MIILLTKNKKPVYIGFNKMLYSMNYLPMNIFYSLNIFSKTLVKYIIYEICYFSLTQSRLRCEWLLCVTLQMGTQ